MFLFFDFEDIHIKVCLVERGVKFVKGANSESEILNSRGIERLPTLINVKMRLVICIGSSVAEWGFKIPVTQVRFLLDAFKGTSSKK